VDVPTAITIFVVTTAYLAPTILAGVRSHRNLVAIFVLNACLGWTVVGYISALVWACITTERKLPIALEHNLTVVKKVG